MTKKTQVFTTTYFAPMFDQYNTPNGNLVDHPACHALWFYYVHAYKAYEQQDTLVYEDEAWPIANFQQLMKTAILIYGAEPGEMQKFWPNVDMQCFMLNLPKLPKQYRFAAIPEIKTN